MKGKLLSVLMAIVLLILAGCGDGTKTARSDKHRETSPKVNETDLAAQIGGNSTFAFDLYHEIKTGNDNLFYSPYSISVALAMTYAGARGETEQQMAETLHFILSQDSLHPSFNALDIQLAARGEGAKGKEGEGFQLNIVNAIWGQEDYKFLSEFLDVLAENYGAGLRLLDFAKAPEESRITINRWISEQTEGRIEDMIPQGTIDTLTRLVLTNAIYFNAAWQNPFSEDRTEEGMFHLLNDDEVTVPMMRHKKSFDYVDGEGYQAVELPYDGREISMVILLPDSGQFETFEGSLNAEEVEAIVEQLSSYEVNLTMPKFTLDSSFELGKTLSNMGMPDAFLEGVADFSGMDSTRELFIREVVHKAFVAVDEAGTEAAAATEVVMEVAVEKPAEITIDRPFIFLIRDIETGTILFVGRVMNPIA
ncbi:MAG: serpin family protein [Chloroflexota bacterium]|nr:serpin family protein [Chloroflexota bacterium]